MTNEEIKAAESVRIPIGPTLDISYAGETAFWCKFDEDRRYAEEQGWDDFTFDGILYDFATGELLDWDWRKQKGIHVGRFLAPFDDDPQYAYLWVRTKSHDLVLEAEEGTMYAMDEGDSEAVAMAGTLTPDLLCSVIHDAVEKLRTMTNEAEV